MSFIIETNFFCFSDFTENRKRYVFNTNALALIVAASPDLEKQGFLAVVFIIGNTADSRK
ncbi:hypothetical protein ACFX5E_14745 [Flavobacterium sp. LS2P90]|uniref:Uncharacterized protein n=1 Tax=Flavobacterium xylosi TaxID=3230415 RepID=A0ABW6HZ69_9FLAO